MATAAAAIIEIVLVKKSWKWTANNSREAVENTTHLNVGRHAKSNSNSSFRKGIHSPYEIFAETWTVKMDLSTRILAD